MTDTVDAATFAPLEGTDPALPGDPFARPRYSYGQLLGADDFSPGDPAVAAHLVRGGS